MKLISAAVVSSILAASAQAADWQMDPSRSELAFVAKYENEDAPGRFRRFDAQLTFDPEKPQAGRLHVTVDVTSADMDSRDLYEGMRTPEWFAMDAIPEAVFDSHEIERVDDRHFVARGSLQIKGQVRTISLPFAWDRNEGNAVMAGQVDLRRDWFGIGSGEWAGDDPIALDVKVTYHVTWRPDD